MGCDGSRSGLWREDLQVEQPLLLPPRGFSSSDLAIIDLLLRDQVIKGSVQMSAATQSVTLRVPAEGGGLWAATAVRQGAFSRRTESVHPPRIEQRDQPVPVPLPGSQTRSPPTLLHVETQKLSFFEILRMLGGCGEGSPRAGGSRLHHPALPPLDALASRELQADERFLSPLFL